MAQEPDKKYTLLPSAEAAEQATNNRKLVYSEYSRKRIIIWHRLFRNTAKNLFKLAFVVILFENHNVTLSLTHLITLPLGYHRSIKY